MTKEQVIKLLTVLECTYPSFYRDLSENHKKAMAEIWLIQFKNIDYKNVYSAIMDLISKSKFPPTIAEIKQYMVEEMSNDDMTATEAWNCVYKSICNSLYNAAEEFNKLPNKAKLIVGSASELRRLATFANPTDLGIYQNRFIKEFGEIRDSDKFKLQITLNKNKEIEVIND